MKKLVIFIVVLAVLGMAAFAGWFYWKNLRGAGPAFGPVEEDITEAIPQKKEEAEDALNKTDFPLGLPDGFVISIFAKDLSGARDMVVDGMGNVWVSRPGDGIITLLEIGDGGLVTNKNDVFKRMEGPHGLAVDPLNPLDLYIAEEDSVSRVELYTEDSLEKLVDLPTGGRHTTRSLVFGADERLYVSIGSSCDTCVEEDERRASIYVMEKNGSDFRKFADGLRNSVFMTIHPETNELWATEMGRDYLGDDLPPDEINIVEEGDYGWPYCYGKNVHDDEFDPDNEESCEDKKPSLIDLQAHSAPLGLDFVPEDIDWPEEYKHDLIVAYHGSWNRTIPTGYKLVRIKMGLKGLPEDTDYKVEDFIYGWLTESGESLGRPVDVLFMNDYLLVSDDKAGVIYKIDYQ
ncbi:oxidoreductase [Candidatus Peregrinibacteria bacterium]|nr:oxidoreductase [Candidatus Peregrinibacteria bacterium]